MEPGIRAPRTFRQWSLVFRLALAGLFLLTAACATSQTTLLQRSKPGPQWPEAPMAPQIEWVKSISTPEDAGIGVSFWKRIVKLIAGPDPHQFLKPYGVLYDAADRLIVADTGAGVVHLMDTRQRQYRRITKDQGRAFISPIGLAEDASGRLYITDSEAGAVYRYDLATGQLSLFMGKLARPTGIAYNSINHLLYISETTAHRVLAVDENAKVRWSFGDTPGSVGILPFNLPTDIAVDRKGQVYVNDPLNYKIRIFTPEGLQVGQFGAMGDSSGEMNKPKGIAVDPEGNVYVADALLDAVQIFDDTGQFLFTFGGVGTEDGAFWMPSGICIRGEYIFVTDTFNQRIQIFRRVAPERESSAVSGVAAAPKR
ncbi:hypothetical protein GMSM_16090 [Geomonas sp. Red276]